MSQDSDVTKPETALTKRTEPVLEEIAGHGIVARDVTGQFIRKSKVSMLKNMRESQKFLEQVPKNSEVSRAQKIRESVYANVCAAGPDDLIGQTKGAQFLENSAYGKTKEKVLDEPEHNGGVKIIIINQDYGLAPPLSEEEQAKRDAPKLKPTFAEVIEVQTNPVDPTVNFRQRGERPAPGEPSDNSVADHIAKAQERFSR